MQEEKKISIIMPTYNGERFIKLQLDSILNQTVKNYELIICDDVSSDDTVNILRHYEEIDSRIKVYINSHNIGINENFQKLVNLASGEYIAFCDQDDIWYPEKLETCLENLNENDFICCNSNFIDVDGNVFNTMLRHLGIHHIYSDKIAMLKHLLISNYVQGATILAKRDFILKYLPIPSDFPYNYDYYFSLCSLINNSFIYIKEPLQAYRIHPQQVTDNSKKTINEKFFSLFRKKSLSDDKIKFYNYLLNNSLFNDYNSYILKSFEFEKNTNKFVSFIYYFLNYKYITFDTNPLRKLRRCVQFFVQR